MANNPGDRDKGNYGGQSGAGSSQRDQSEGQRGQQSSQRSPESGKTDRTQQTSGAQNSGSQSGRTGSDINLRLTPEQQAQIRQATGKNLQSLSLSVEDLNQETGSRSDASGSSSSMGSSEDERDIEE